MSTKTQDAIDGTIWLGDADGDPIDSPAVLEGETTRIEIERTDEDELAIHATMPGDRNALVSLYMTREQATWLAAVLIKRATS